jgi:NAD(P)H-hydrate epimerase
MSDIDRRSQGDYHIPGILLMENAGAGVFSTFSGYWNGRFPGRPLRDLRITCVAGGGNNGGDTLVVARHAHTSGIPNVRVVIRNRKLNKQMETHAAIVEALGLPVLYWEEDPQQALSWIVESDIVFDGIAGTGLDGALRGTAAEMVEGINSGKRLFTVAVDVPSGVGDYFRIGMPAVRADMTVTMGLPKISLYTPAGRVHCGRIVSIDPGFAPALLADPPDAVRLVDLEELADLLHGVSLSGTPPHSYKGSRGHTAVFAGSMGTTGAAILGAESAARAGSGLVTLRVDREIYPLIAGQCTSLMVRPLIPEEELADKYTALLIGPGWGNSHREELLHTLLKSRIPGVIDADGIRVLSGLISKIGIEEVRRLLGGRFVITPHPGEFGVLLEACGLPRDRDTILSNPLEALSETARLLNAVVVLKSHVVWILSPDGPASVVDGMNPAMGTGGSGDVLAGTIAGLTARGIGAFDAACAGCAVHQEAGRRVSEKIGWFMAEDLPQCISGVLGHTGA